MGKLLCDWDDLRKREKVELFTGVIQNISYEIGCDVPDEAYDGLLKLTCLAYQYLQEKCECDGRSLYYHYDDFNSSTQAKIDETIASMVLAVLNSEEDDDGGIDWMAIVKGGFRLAKVASFFMGGLGLFGLEDLIDSIGGSDFT